MPSAPTWALLAGAAFWGVVWYPYRLLAQAGLDGIWSTIFTYGFALVAGLALQYGLSRLPANRAIVILLFELVVGAVAAYVLAGEIMRPQDWAGGTLIVAASFASAWMERRARPRAA